MRSLRSANKSPRTVTIYRDTGAALLAFLVENGMPTTAASLTREHVERYLVHLAECPHRRKPGQKVSPAYVSQQYRAPQQLFKWLRIEGEITVDPFDRMSPPAVPEQPVPVLTETQLGALLATCRGTTFTDRRDAAIIRFMLDSGVRIAELVGIEVDHLDFEMDVAHVTGKAGAVGPRPSAPARPRPCGATCAAAASSATPRCRSSGSATEAR